MKHSRIDKAENVILETIIDLGQEVSLAHFLISSSAPRLPVNSCVCRHVRSWSHKDKYNFIGLSQSNLRVQYRGHGKTHKVRSEIAAEPVDSSLLDSKSQLIKLESK